MELRPYQEEAVRAVLGEWARGVRKTLLVLPTGCGKTIVFAKVVEEVVRRGGRAMVLAHRGELLQQAADKIDRATGLGCAVEKAAETAEGTWYNVTVASVQSMNPRRLERIRPDEYTHIVIDEAHHALAQTYLRVLDHFPDARVLGVTATADRGDRRELGSLFETLAYEMPLRRAVAEGWLCPIAAATIPLRLDVRHSGGGDYTAAECSHAIEPYLSEIADALASRAALRKTVCFLPLIETSRRFRDLLLQRGLEAREVNGESEDRAETLAWFHSAGPGAVLCNSMLLTEGWDEPSADCVCVLRPTRVRALYAQMVGRGTRLSEGKANLLLLDFLWMSERHDLCRPAHLVSDNPELQERIAEIMAEATTSGAADLFGEADAAEKTAVQEREEALRKELEAQRHKRERLVDPLQFTASAGIGDGTWDRRDLAGERPVSDAQAKALENAGINPGGVGSYWEAARLLAAIHERRSAGLSTPKQIRLLERMGFRRVGEWPFEQARKMVDRIAASGWRVPYGVVPATVEPQPAEKR